jgi:hypothetical protein
MQPLTVGSGYQMHIPWFMYDLTNKQLITTRYIPSDISDVKSMVFTETPIPGLNYQPFMPGGGGNRKISFTMPLIYKSIATGDVGLLKLFDALRNRSSIGSVFGGGSYQFDANPKVLYFWGTGSIPLVYWVTKCDASHKQGWVNAFGQPQYSEIDIELTLDERDPLYKGEELFRSVMGLVGMVQGVAPYGFGPSGIIL